MQRNRLIYIGLLCLALLLSGCEGTTFQSSVPAYPVRVIIDTKIGAFVHFVPTALGSSVVVNKEGYFLDGKRVYSAGITDAWGYGGVVVYVSSNGYDAYDMACPYCAEKGNCHPCGINGARAVCPHCGEEYDLLSGVAVPTQGIAHEALRRLNVINSDGRLTITQR
ncbi:MAG: hypothetical protein II825_01940 [Paludibacteraceae bacterium]|nr:hypothetical protein [Paludibacteraceae bacterium]